MSTTSLIVIVAAIAIVAVLIITIASFTNETENNKPVLSEDEQREAYKESKKEREWADTSEEVRFVCKGGKVQCKYCSSPIAEILPTSTEVMLQDKPYVTVGDKDGKVNFNFTGLCTHSSHGSKKPPCKSVINLVDWKDYSQTMIDDYNALLVKSKIPCMVSGEDLEIVDSGQRAELVSASPNQELQPRIRDQYWINESGERITQIELNKKASLVIETEDYKRSDELRVTLPINGEEKIFTTKVNKEGVAILKNIFMYKAEELIKEPRIIEAYWRNTKVEKISEVLVNKTSEFFIRTEGYAVGAEVKVTITKENNDSFDSGKEKLEFIGEVNHEGITIIKNKTWI